MQIRGLCWSDPPVPPHPRPSDEPIREPLGECVEGLGGLALRIAMRLADDLELQALLHVVSSFDLPPAPCRRLGSRMPMSRSGVRSAGCRENEGGTGGYGWCARRESRAPSTSRRVLRRCWSSGAEGTLVGAVTMSDEAVTMLVGAVARSGGAQMARRMDRGWHAAPRDRWIEDVSSPELRRLSRQYGGMRGGIRSRSRCKGGGLAQPSRVER